MLYTDRESAISLVKKGEVPGLRFLDNAGPTGRFQDTESRLFLGFKEGQLRAATTRELIPSMLETRSNDALLFDRLQEADGIIDQLKKTTI